ncbi:MAG: MOSC domain-containing protein [Sulfitobacter sp.]
MYNLAKLIAGYAQPGVVTWIGLRAERLAPPISVQNATIDESGLENDHGRPGKRAVTLIQAEHLAVIGAMLGRGPIDPSVLRRNFVISGLNLNALKGRRVQIGAAILEITGICAPCSRMEAALGNGGYSAMRGHGGWCATVLQTGHVWVGDHVSPLSALSDSDCVK